MTLSTLAGVVSFAVGFASLGQEILWVRVVSFANGNTPQTFAFVLSLYLLGIVSGALVGKRICEAARASDIRRNGSLALALSASIDVMSPWGLMLAHGSFWFMPTTALLIFSTSASKATLFPIAHHLGTKIDGPNTGRSISRIYFLNILGATASPIIIGFWALDLWTSQFLMQVLGVTTLVIAGMLMPVRRLSLALIVLAASAMLAMSRIDDAALMHTLADKQQGRTISFLRENRHGVIHVLADPAGDVVLGGNIYDGRISVDPVLNSNRIDRVLLLAALQPTARRVLVIGLSGGSWTKVLSEFPGVERIDVVEINPSYLDLIESRTEVRGILQDPRIHIHVDDGRRWLRRYTSAPFDLIVMNTTFHWRAYVTNLLSTEFMKIVQPHLAAGGIFAFNATGSPDALFTAASVFPYAYRWKNSNFIYAAAHDFRRFSDEETRNRLQRVVAALSPPGRYTILDFEQVVDRISETGWIDVAEETRMAGRPLEKITDQNMLTEYRHGRAAWW